jgi:hypothetical protein
MQGAPLSRTKALVICALALAAAGIVVLLFATANGGTARATGLPVVTQNDYSAFGAGTAGSASGMTPPSTRAETGDRPLAASMTRLVVGNADLDVWLAKSSEGGVCVFVERRGAKGAGGSCAPAALLRTGATAVVEEGNGERTIAGVVPDGVSAVTVRFATGDSKTVPVADNGWAIENAPASVTGTADVVGG